MISALPQQSVLERGVVAFSFRAAVLKRQGALGQHSASMLHLLSSIRGDVHRSGDRVEWPSGAARCAWARRERLIAPRAFPGSESLKTPLS